MRWEFWVDWCLLALAFVLSLIANFRLLKQNESLRQQLRQAASVIIKQDLAFKISGLVEAKKKEESEWN